MKRNRIAALLPMFVVPLVLALALPAFASEQSGKIQGSVLDPDGVPLAGVTVTVSSDVLMGVRKTQTADDGSFLFFGLPPGKYKLEVEQTGFLPFRQENLHVPIGGTVSQDVLLELPTAEETVVVTAKRPVVDKEKTVLGQNYDDEFLGDVPVEHQYQSVADLAPGVVDDGSGNPNMHGGSVYSNQYLVDGVNITDPVTNTFSANLNFDAIKEVQVLTGGLDAEYGQATGGIINLVTKSGGNEFHLDTSFYATPDEFRYKDDFEKETAGRQDAYQFNINAGGPIFKDKLWYFGSVELDRTVASLPASQDYFNPSNPNKIQHPSRVFMGVFFLGKLTWQITDAHKLTFMANGDPSTITNIAQDPTVAGEAETEQDQGGYFFSLSWEALWSKMVFQKTMLALKTEDLSQFPMSGCTDVNNPACRSHSDSDTGLTTVNSSANSDDKRYRLQFDSSWTLYLDNLLGDHEAKAGWQYYHTWDDTWASYPGGASYNDQSGRPYRITELVKVNGQYQDIAYTLKGDVLSFYIQDAWKITKYFTIKPGVRFDWGVMRDDKDNSILNFVTTSPRINFVWDVTKDGKTVIRGGYGRYVDTGYLSISGAFARSLGTETYQYNAATGQYDIFVTKSGGEVQNFVVKPNLTAPHNDEITLGVERELFTDFSLSATAIWREMKYIFEDDEQNQIWNQQGTDVIGYKNGQETYLFSLGTPREAWRRYWGFELSARKNYSDNWQMEASYTYSRAEGAPDTYFSAYLDNPRQTQYYWSWLGYDVRHVIKIDGSYHLPYGFQIGAEVNYFTGAPYSKLAMNKYWGGYDNYVAKRGYDPNHPGDEYWNRTPDVFRINLRLIWNLKELTGQQIDIIAQMYNVLGLRNKTDLETRDLPAGNARQYGNYYGETTSFQAQLGLRYRY